MTTNALILDDLKEEAKAKGVGMQDFPRYRHEWLSQLTPEQLASYAARSETIRLEQWDQFEREQREERERMMEIARSRCQQ